jgi:hypothetical protein
MNMLTLISDSKNIYSLTQNGERRIHVRKGTKYVVILPAFFGLDAYTCHTNEQTAIKQYHKLIRDGYTINSGSASPEIIDTDGNWYYVREEYPGEYELLMGGSYHTIIS